jgi:multidrug efflux pump subunit AcrB
VFSCLLEDFIHLKSAVVCGAAPMWIVQLALRRPHTFVVMAIVIAMFGVISIVEMAVDIFPVIDIPVVSCVWTYVGMSPYDMESLITTVTERALTSTINGIQRMESMSLAGMGIVKIYLQKGTPVGESVSMVASVGTAIRRQMPRGISAPFVTASSATDVPVIQLALHSDTLDQAKVFDIANNLLRSQIATVQGTITPFPYGGKFRQVMVDIDPYKLTALGLAPEEIVTAIKNENVISPDGTAKMGNHEYILTLNNMAKNIDDLNQIPVKTVNGNTVFVKDVAQVHDGYQPQTNIVNINGKPAVLFNILKAGSASTLTVVQKVKELLPRLREIVPAGCSIDVLVDQSKFVEQCVGEVVREACTAAALTALMMLALLGSWRSTLIVATSIPLAILAAIVGLNIAGQTINSMTLGGLALAVGMLVDDATVAIENLHVNLAMGKPIEQAILDGAQQVALPALVSTMSICIVFVPVVFLTEPSRSLFLPLGMSVVLAMMASYGLSRTIVPLMSKVLLSGHTEHKAEAGKPNVFTTIHKVIDTNFERLREIYTRALERVLENPAISLAAFVLFFVGSFCVLPQIGADYFPLIDSGQLRLHVSAHAGTRIEQTEHIFHRIEAAIRRTIPAKELVLISDNIGMPVNPINYAYSDSQTVSAADGEILITIGDNRTKNTQEYQKIVRKLVAEQFPEVKSYFQPADIITQILNAGLPAPIDIRVIGMKRKENYLIAKEIQRKVTQVSGVADVCLHQVVDAPHIFCEVDRAKAGQLGVTQSDVSNSVLVSLSSSFQTNPNFWVNSATGINYQLAVQTPQYKLASLQDLQMTPVTASAFPTDSALPQPQMLTNVASFHRDTTIAVANHVNVQPVYDIYAAPQGRDLFAISTDIKKILDEYKKHAKQGTFIFMGGQVMSMYQAFAALIGGLAFSLVLVYLLLVVNFQSWTDPLIILMAIPGAFSGIIWGLYLTQTTFSIPALMGTIMCVGVASANSILMVTFANEQRAEGFDAFKSALNAGNQRFRQVIMTATAMIIGMIPMAIGTGDGGSQNAPIGRAVIGGLSVATFSTLFFVPLIFKLMRGRAKHVDS